MSDARLNSMHLEFPRRDRYRAARATVLEGRGWQTICFERVRDVLGSGDDWPSVVPALPAAGRFLLVDYENDVTHSLKTGLNTVGRYDDNDVVFHSSCISRRHCVIVVHASGECDLHDTASRNGTCVNGRRIAGPTPLASGDWIQLCNRRVLFLHENDFQHLCDHGEGPDTAVL